MRNLKKLLSMLLVVAMIVSLCAVGSFSAAAAYSETTNYNEAAQVITGIGVMDGYEDGTMQYDKAVTREEAAAIICRALIGADTAKKLTTAVAPFADVAANRWSAPYINYLKSQGIVNGKTATEFDPTAEVTGVEFAKMLLCAAGYGKAGEFVGASWDVNTITAANNNGVYMNTKALDLTAAATREECMLYAFNTITKVPTVKYNTTFASYYAGESVMNGVPTNVDATVPAGNYKYTLAYRNFKLYATDDDTTDAFGRPASAWAIENGKVISSAVVNAVPTATFVGAVSSATISTLGKEVVKDLNAAIYAGTADTIISYYVDGELVAGFPYSEIKSNEILANGIAGAGAVTEAYVDYDAVNTTYNVRFVVINEYFAKVTKVDTAKNELTLTIYKNDGALAPAAANVPNIIAKGDDVNIAGFAKNDYALINIALDTVAGTTTVTSIAPVNSFVGTYTNDNFMMQKVIDGTAYGNSKWIDLRVAPAKTGTYTFYTDSQGNLISCEAYDGAAVTDTAKYLFVIEAKAQTDGDILNGAEAAVAIKVVYPNGGKDVLYCAVKEDATGDYILVNGAKKYITAADKLDGTAIDTVLANRVWAYTANDAGDVTLKAANTDYTAFTTADFACTTSKAAVTGLGAGFTANSKTVLTFVDKNGNVSTYTGIASFPTKTVDDANIFYTFANNSKVAKTIFVYTGDDAVSNTINFAYAVMQWDADAEGTTYMFYIDGAAQFIKLSSALPGFTSTVYDLTCTNGEYTAAPIAALGGADAGLINGAGYNAMFAADFAPNAASADLQLGVCNFNAMAIENYYEWATIGSVDDNFFTTVAATAEDSLTGTDVAARTYYTDSKTVVYDVVNGGTTELTEGQHFVAYVDKDASVTFSGENYVSYIWIVG